ncbi:MULTISPECIES: hypothetical protein [Bradyrhizobium]|uniref:hypothetical protein n=1 Tax=Bradyrhizobium TaxID=374 RepID=UPI001FD8BE9D|nr:MULTISPECIES: hypothetical protein [Bradyrhizobium]MCP1838392.1 hypothetical protein [Bradyrhizobium sp. USDA 4538]MCP1898956.1 hypothetical protein [Bradyrhizobium sp. USDA 4537]MCP1909450.1 hypothetical protein [Bradyrhizobium elkanii]MCP1986930.1 hypothetical protein [Bradyrhizobium sp. USDA 4539]
MKAWYDPRSPAKAQSAGAGGRETERAPACIKDGGAAMVGPLRSPFHDMQLRHLELAERHVAQGERRIAEQEQRIGRMANRGQNVTDARKILDSFNASQALFVQHRDEIRKALGE